MKQMTLNFTRPILPALDDPALWLQELFASKAARDGHVIRRKAREIERFAGWDRFLAELARRGYRAVENDGQVVIFCNRAPVRVIYQPPGTR